MSVLSFHTRLSGMWIYEWVMLLVHSILNVFLGRRCLYIYIWSGLPVVCAFMLFVPHSDTNCLNGAAENGDLSHRATFFPNLLLSNFAQPVRSRAWRGLLPLRPIFFKVSTCCAVRDAIPWLFWATVAFPSSRSVCPFSSDLSHQQGLFTSTQLDSSSFLGTFCLKPKGGCRKLCSEISFSTLAVKKGTCW